MLTHGERQYRSMTIEEEREFLTYRIDKVISVGVLTVQAIHASLGKTCGS